MSVDPTILRAPTVHKSSCSSILDLVMANPSASVRFPSRMEYDRVCAPPVSLAFSSSVRTKTSELRFSLFSLSRTAPRPLAGRFGQNSGLGAVAMQRKHGGYAGIQSFFAFLPKNISVEIFFMPQNKVPRVGASPQKRVVVLKVLGPPIISSS